MIKNISHVMLWAMDLEKTKSWYKEKLGFQINYYAPGEFLSMHEDNMGRLDFHQTNESEQIGKGPLPYYVVEDIEKVKAWLEGKDIKVNDIQQVGDSPKHTWFWDCNGNAFGIEEH